MGKRWQAGERLYLVVVFLLLVVRIVGVAVLLLPQLLLLVAQQVPRLEVCSPLRLRRRVAAAAAREAGEASTARDARRVVSPAAHLVMAFDLAANLHTGILLAGIINITYRYITYRYVTVLVGIYITYRYTILAGTSVSMYSSMSAQFSMWQSGSRKSGY